MRRHVPSCTGGSARSTLLVLSTALHARELPLSGIRRIHDFCATPAAIGALETVIGAVTTTERSAR